MSDPTLTTALRFAGKRASWTPAREYHGDRPNIAWSAFLLRLANPEPRKHAKYGTVQALAFFKAITGHLASK